jgi:predicted TIM-barrel fold metal-dependent hydrolase
MTRDPAEGYFDMHQHVGVLIGIPGMEAGATSLETDAAMRLAFMDDTGIGQAALMPTHAYTAPNGLADVRALNDVLVAYQKLAPDRFPLIIGTLDPRHGLRAAAEVERLHGLGFRGLSWHHRMQGLPMDHPVMFAIVERMDALGMVVMPHCYANGDFESPWRLRRLAERFPRTAFLALDAMTSPENLEQILGAAEVLANIHVDLTTNVLGAQGVHACVDRLGAERLLFGTNYYSMSPSRPPEELDHLAAAGLSEVQTRLVTSGNARRLFGLGEPPRLH